MKGPSREGLSCGLMGWQGFVALAFGVLSLCGLSEAQEEKAALIEAAEAGDFRGVMDLLQSGTDPSVARSDGWPPFMAAAFIGSRDVFSLLSAAGADPKATDASGYSVLMAAARGGDWEIFREVKARAGWEPFADANGYNLLMAAARGGNSRIFSEVQGYSRALADNDAEGYSVLRTRQLGRTAGPFSRPPPAGVIQSFLVEQRPCIRARKRRPIRTGRRCSRPPCLAATLRWCALPRGTATRPPTRTVTV